MASFAWPHGWPLFGTINVYSYSEKSKYTVIEIGHKNEFREKISFTVYACLNFEMDVLCLSRSS